MDYLLITRADGGLSILQRLEGMGQQAELDKWESQANPEWLPVVGVRLVVDPVFPDRTGIVGTFVANREAWVDDGVNIVIDPARITSLEAAAYADFKAKAAAVFGDKRDKIARALRALAPVILARINATDQCLADLFVAIASASSLADLKVRCAAINVPPQFTLAQMKTAIINAIDSTDSD